MQPECSSPQSEACLLHKFCMDVTNLICPNVTMQTAAFMSESMSVWASIIYISFQEEAALPWSSGIMSAGASSFGMSGVNAHGLFTSPKALKHTVYEVDWQRERHYMAPSSHHMLASAQYSRQAGQCR